MGSTVESSQGGTSPTEPGKGLPSSSATLTETLDQLLAALNEKQGLLDHLKELGAFGMATKDDFDKLVCDGLKKDVAAKQDAVKAADQAIKDLQAQPVTPDFTRWRAP